MSTTSKGRQSLPPMSGISNAYSTPKQNNNRPFSSGGGGHNMSGGSMILSSTRIKPQPPSSSIGGGLSTSRSMGNLRGSSEGASASPISVSGGGDKFTMNKPPKKKNKKGMKGWAWVVEDENGNIIDAPENEVAVTVENKRDLANQSKSINDGIAVQTSPAPQDIDSDNGDNGDQRTNVNHMQVDSNTNDLFASSPLPSRASTATAELIPSKRNRQSTSPIIESALEDNDINQNHEALSSAAAQSGSESSAPTPAAHPSTAIPPTTAASSSKVPHSAKSDTHPKKKRKTSPVPATTTPSLVRSTSNSKVPTTSNANGGGGKYKTPRVSTVGSTAPTRAQRAFLIRESNSASRAGSQHVVEDDTPLPPPPPRTGMGEGAFPIPKESFMRQENSLLRQEAEFIIQQTSQHLKDLEKEKERQHRNGTLPVQGKRNRKSINYNEVDDDDDEVNMSDNDDEDNDQDGVWEEGRAGPGPSTSSNSRLRSRRSINGNGNGVISNNENGNGNPRRRSSINFPAPTKDQSFEGQFNQLQKEQKAQILAEKAAEQSRPPNFPKNAKPTVVLANGTLNGIGGRTVPRDRVEKAYQDGLSGLSNEMETDSQGFVDNVKENLRAILKYYFPERSPRRDAFCERIGRGLAQLGWELTDNSDAALLP